MIIGYSKLHTYLSLSNRGLKPLLQKLDNEVPASLKKYMQQNEVNYQLVPPYLHGQNTAERAIGCFKDHFIVGLCSTDKNWPINLWCRFLPQYTVTLNILWHGPAPGGNKSPNSNNSLSVIHPSSVSRVLFPATHTSILIVAAIPFWYICGTNSGMLTSSEGNLKVYTT